MIMPRERRAPGQCGEVGVMRVDRGGQAGLARAN